ncbi:MAG TPA: hypothetical protein VMT71_17175 [Syntrophorhabdales bacterium]|nr:hypothetical protein [Syntrophorhabdales bacterium]
MKRCYKCGTTIEIEKVSRRDECPNCGSDVRVCLNCAFFSESKANSCEESQAEPVKEKDRATYCDFFRFSEKAGRYAVNGIKPAQKNSAKAEAEKLWNELFKKP